MIKSAIASMRSAQEAALSVDVIYSRGDSRTAVKAVPGRTVFRSANAYGQWVLTESRDFIVPSGALPSEPERGDTVEWDGESYEVLAPEGEPVWRWSDPYKTAMRIHTKHTGGA